MSKSELPTFSMGKGMGGSLPCRLIVEDGHGRGGENAATEEHLVRQIAALPDEQLLRVLETNGFTLPAKLRALQRELEQERAGRVRAEAAIRFVEEHGETLEAVLVDATSHREDYFKCEREALEALRRLTAERGESLP